MKECCSPLYICNFRFTLKWPINLGTCGNSMNLPLQHFTDNCYTDDFFFTQARLFLRELCIFSCFKNTDIGVSTVV